MTKVLKVQDKLLGEIRSLVEQPREQLAVTVNSAMTMPYWQIGNRINQEVLKGQRGEYGQRVVVFPDHEIVVSLIRQLSWTHLLAVIAIDDPLKRSFYIEMRRLEKWSVRTFRDRINSMLYERTAIARNNIAVHIEDNTDEPK